jgi:hypothetical protein
MDTQSFGTGFRYMDPEQVHRSDAELMVGAEIRDRQNEKVGELDGFVVNAHTGQPRYAVVDAGGWFKSDRFLLPIAHLEKTSNGTLHANIDKAAIKAYPEFDETDWMRASTDQRWDFGYQTLVACCPADAAVVTADEKQVEYDRWQHYRKPRWWQLRQEWSESNAQVG